MVKGTKNEEEEISDMRKGAYKAGNKYAMGIERSNTMTINIRATPNTVSSFGTFGQALRSMWLCFDK